MVRILVLLLVLSGAHGLFGGHGLLAQEALSFERDPSPKLFVTDFTWYHANERANGGVDPRSLACTRAQPRRAAGEIATTDYLSSDGYYGGKYRRFKSHGIDGVAFVVTDRVPDSFDGGNTVQAAELAIEAGLDFFAYYDLFVTTAKESRLVLCTPGSKCPLGPGAERIPAYNLNTRPRIYDQLLEDFERIAVHMIQPHMAGEGASAGYLMLEDENGNRVLDEMGLPRPVIALYIARTLADKSANFAKIGQLMDEVTDIFRSLGLGKPAMVLDVIFWVTPTAEILDTPYDPEIVEAFGDHAVAITWYGFFDTFRGGLKNITNDGPRPPMEVWAKYLNQQYQRARDLLVASEQPLMIWPGGQTQIDTRDIQVDGCRRRGINVVYHLRSAEDWRAMLTRMLSNGWRPQVSGQAPLQTLSIITNAGEWFESGGVDFTRPDKAGECGFPFNWCESLLQVIREEDRHP